MTALGVQPIAAAPIGGADHFPPETPKDEPLNFVLLWQPAAGRWRGGWRLGFWGGAQSAGWYDDDMGLMKPQPTHWIMLPPKPLAFAGDVDPARQTITVSGKVRRLPPAECRLFEILYQADLVDGEWRSAGWLCAQLGMPRRAAPELRRHIDELRRRLAGSRFAVEGNRQRGYRLAVSPIGPPARR